MNTTERNLITGYICEASRSSREAMAIVIDGKNDRAAVAKMVTAKTNLDLAMVKLIEGVRKPKQ